MENRLQNPDVYDPIAQRMVVAAKAFHLDLARCSCDYCLG
jgi:hypothetical protein